MRILARSCFLVVTLLLATTVRAQSTSLLVNGQTQATNGLQVDVENGTVVTIEIDGPFPNGLYGLFGALNNIGGGTGWDLDVSGAVDPFPVVTGIGTAFLSGQVGVNISPTRAFNPLYRCDGNGQRTLSFLIPSGYVGMVYLQAVVMQSTSFSYTISNSILLNVVNPTQGARLLVCRDATPGDPDDVEFGVLSFSGSPATNGAYVADATLVSVDVQDVNLGGIQQWAAGNGNGADLASSPNLQADRGPALNLENDQFPRIALPASSGPDGLPNTADDLPPRDLLRCLDNVTQEGFWMIVNKGSNPNTALDFFEIPGTRVIHSSPGTNPWSTTCGVSRDGTVMAAVRNTGGNDRILLIAVDGSLPYSGAAVSDVTPALLAPRSVNGIFPDSIRFLRDDMFFVLDDGNDDPLGNEPLPDGVNEVLFSAEWSLSNPTTTETIIPFTGNGWVADIIPAGSLIASEDGRVLVFLGGDIENLGGSVPDHLQEADWFSVSNNNPDNATNLTEVGLAQSGMSPRLFFAGDAFNGQSGFASLSPNGTALAVVMRHDDENGAEEDEVYFVRTDGSDVTALLQAQLTSNAFFDTPNNANLAKAQDVVAIDANVALFFYGENDNGHIGDRMMDLFHWDRDTQGMTNLTMTGDVVFPVLNAGDVYPEGYFLAPAGDYLYFGRGDAAFPSRTNLVGINLSGMSAFNVTGSEFAGLPAPATGRNGVFGDSFSWHLTYAGGDLPSLVYFSAALDGVSTGQEVWTFDADFPFTAISLSDEQTAGQNVEVLVPSATTLGAAWAFAAGGDTAAADVYHVDLTRGFMDDLTESGRSDAVALGGIRYVPARAPDGGGGNAAPPGLVYATGSVTPDNPTDALFSHVTLDGASDQTGATIVDQNAILVGNILQVFHADNP